LYKMTIENRLQAGDDYHDIECAIDDLKSIKAKTDYMLTRLTGWGVHHEK